MVTLGSDLASLTRSRESVKRWYGRDYEKRVLQNLDRTLNLDDLRGVGDTTLTVPCL